MKLKAKFESGPAFFTFKGIVEGVVHMGFIGGFNLRRPTMMILKKLKLMMSILSPWGISVPPRARDGRTWHDCLLIALEARSDVHSQNHPWFHGRYCPCHVIRWRKGGKEGGRRVETIRGTRGKGGTGVKPWGGKGKRRGGEGGKSWGEMGGKGGKEGGGGGREGVEGETEGGKGSLPRVNIGNGVGLRLMSKRSALTRSRIPRMPMSRGLHSSTYQLNVSALLCDRGCVQGVFSGCLQGVGVC